jgi:hypothetical protein
MSASFSKKSLVASLTLGVGDFNSSGNTKVVDGLRMTAYIRKGGHPSKNVMRLRIFGMLENDMSAFTSLSFKPMRVRKNLVQLLAGDAGGMAVAFSGEVTSAFSSYSSHRPVFTLEATSGYYPSIATSSAKSFSGSTSVALLMKTLADEMGYAFENDGVVSVLDSPYLCGNAMSQASMLAEAADLEFGVDDSVLFIAPRNKARSGTAPLISPETGLEEYPTFDKNGLKFKCLYNPSLKLGGLCVVQSMVRAANGTWRIHGLEHELSSEDPGGKWHTRVHATQPGVPPAEEGGSE